MAAATFQVAGDQQLPSWTVQVWDITAAQGSRGVCTQILECHLTAPPLQDTPLNFQVFCC